MKPEHLAMVSPIMMYPPAVNASHEESLAVFVGDGCQ
jgi:hypothetical protein